MNVDRTGSMTSLWHVCNLSAKHVRHVFAINISTWNVTATNEQLSVQSWKCRIKSKYVIGKIQYRGPTKYDQCWDQRRAAKLAAHDWIGVVCSWHRCVSKLRVWRIAGLSVYIILCVGVYQLGNCPANLYTWGTPWGNIFTHFPAVLDRLYSLQTELLMVFAYNFGL